MAASGRLLYYCHGRDETLMLTYVDDISWITQSSQGLVRITGSLFLLVLLGTPLAWHKFSGGKEHSWIGFALDVGARTVGILLRFFSVEDAETEAFEAKIDPVTNTIKIKSGKHTVAIPSTPEELRLRHRRIGLAWDMLCTKHFNRSWLSSNMTDCMRRFSDFILGHQVAGLVAHNRTPPWSLVLSFEFEARKATYKWIRDQECATLSDAFKRAAMDVELLNRRFIIPFTLNPSGGNSQQASSSRVPPPPASAAKRKKGGGKGKDKFGNADIASKKLTKATDGTPICWKYNRRGGCSDAQCRFPAHLPKVPRQASGLQLQAR